MSTPFEPSTAHEYWSRPVKVTAIVWHGGDVKPLDLFLDPNYYEISTLWNRADAVDMDDIAMLGFDKDPEQIVIFDSYHQCWNPCPVGWYIVKGPLGNYIPLHPAQFLASYSSVEQFSRPPRRKTTKS